VQQLDDVGRLLDEDDARQVDLAQQLRVETGPQYAQQPAGVRVHTNSQRPLPASRPKSIDNAWSPPTDRHAVCVSPSHTQWPPLLSVVQHRQLPSVVEERVHSRQVFSLCGLFPEIHRAWATVDNALFLWRYDVEYAPPTLYARRQQHLSLLWPTRHFFLQVVARPLLTELPLLLAPTQRRRAA
jgi:hypothetical protein